MAAITNRHLFVLLARLALAGVFVTAALPKIEDPVAFASSVDAFRVIDAGLSRLGRAMLALARARARDWDPSTSNPTCQRRPDRAFAATLHHAASQRVGART